MLKIKKKDWENYINALAGVSERAAKDMQDFVDKNGMEDVTMIIAKSYQCSVKYGEAAMALTCEMYDKIAVVQGAKVPPAVPARSVTMQEVKDTVNHALRTAPSTVPAVAGKLVKKSSSRTMRKNAARDGARMALVPSGDGCPFCKMLGSRGWEPARSKRSKTFEAHLHAHCRCEYVVDFTGDMQVEGYDPEALYDEFMNLDGTSWEERMNIMRNQQRKIPAIRDKINAQKRAAYVREKTNEMLTNGADNGIMYRKKKDNEFIEPMPRGQLMRIVKAFRRNGGVIQMDAATDHWLKNVKHVEGITYNANTILLMRKPGRASVFEELIHTTQYRQGKLDGSERQRLICEIEAKEKLLKYRKTYKLTDKEIKDTERLLLMHRKELDIIDKGGAAR